MSYSFPPVSSISIVNTGGGGSDPSVIPEVAKSIMTPQYSMTTRGTPEDVYIKINLMDEYHIVFSGGTGFREHISHDLDQGLWTVPSGFKGNWNFEINQLVVSASASADMIGNNLGYDAPNWRFKLYQRKAGTSDAFIQVDSFDYQKTYLPLGMRMPIEFFWEIAAYDFDAEYYCAMQLLSYGKPQGDNEVFIPRLKAITAGQETLFKVPTGTHQPIKDSAHPNLMYSSDVVLSTSAYIEF